MSYYNGQVVYDLDAKKPVKVGGAGDGQWAHFHGVKRSTHFITTPKESTTSSKLGKYEIALPASVEEAQALMDEGRIMPAPVPYTHCAKCMNWWTNHNPDGSCWKK